MTGVDRAREAQVALTRFGLGARPGEPAGILGDPRGFVLSQLARKGAGRIAAPAPSTAAILRDYTRSPPKLKRTKLPAGKPMPADAMVNPAVEYYRTDVLLRARHAVTTDAGFVERLVMFWSNFFAVSGEKNLAVRATLGAYERETIRPHVLGRFADMLLAATRHPAMLTYLDNNQSVGPRSRRGKQRGVGLNENLARETLELHSLGVDGGYTQRDVTVLAKIITGWRTAVAGDPSRLGTFYFDKWAHEPGDFTMLGFPYAETGVRQGEAALADLARHPATARHIAVRLARHFIADAPPPDLIEHLARAFTQTDGNLREVAAALASADAAWAATPTKFLPPYDFVVAAHRLTGTTPEKLKFVHLTAQLGQQCWNPGSPAGWSDGDAFWMAPGGLVRRLDWAGDLAASVGETIDVVGLAADALGPRLQPETREAVARAATRPQGLALLIASSEFQTR